MGEVEVNYCDPNNLANHELSSPANYIVASHSKDVDLHIDLETSSILTPKIMNPSPRCPQGPQHTSRKRKRRNNQNTPRVAARPANPRRVMKGNRSVGSSTNASSSDGQSKDDEKSEEWSWESPVRPLGLRFEKLSWPLFQKACSNGGNVCSTSAVRRSNPFPWDQSERPVTDVDDELSHQSMAVEIASSKSHAASSKLRSSNEIKERSWLTPTKESSAQECNSSWSVSPPMWSNFGYRRRELFAANDDQVSTQSVLSKATVSYKRHK